MTKEEKIKSEYEKLGLPFNENIIFDNGWLKIKPGLYSSKYDDLDLLKLTNHVHSIRPKSLTGIEDNNGWTKIENSSDLPDLKYELLIFRTKEGFTTTWQSDDIKSTPNYFLRYSHWRIKDKILDPIF